MSHQVLQGVKLEVTLVSNMDAITPHLRRHPVDLLLYDERLGLEAQEALRKISRDVAAFASLWGPDFLFPMSRVVCILSHDDNEARRAFELGRFNIRDVCVSPRNTAQILRWLVRILAHDMIRNDQVGMALSGGGLEGFLYQIGALHALNKAISGRTVASINSFSGISSGSICAALLAGEVPTSEVIRALYGKSDVLEPMVGSLLFDVAGTEITKRIMKASVSWAGSDPSKWARKILQAVPTGFFKGEALKNYIRRAIEAYGQNDSFDGLKSELFIGATDQDSFEHVTFGKPPWVDVSISDALRASCALPPFFTPTQINGRHFIDGQVTKTCNLELLVERHCRLIFIIDPMKPLATTVPGSVDKHGGVYAVLQTVKALVHTRFHQTLMHMTERYPDVDFMVFQPDEECAHLMAGSPMRYRVRTQIVSAAFRHTLRQLRERHPIYSAKLGRFGFNLASTDRLLNLERCGHDLLQCL
jgi:predicted acylesterase/phospholipase RssA